MTHERNMPWACRDRRRKATPEAPVPGVPVVAAAEALARSSTRLPDAEGDAWLADMAGADRAIAAGGLSDPWA